MRMFKKIIILYLISILLLIMFNACKGKLRNEDNRSNSIMESIKTDQLGYRRIGVKQAVIADLKTETFDVIRVTDNEIVFSGEL